MADVALTVRVVARGIHPTVAGHTDRMVTACRNRDHVSPTSEAMEAGRVVTHTEDGSPVGQSDCVEVAGGHGLHSRSLGDVALSSAVVADGQDGAVSPEPNRVPVTRSDASKVCPRRDVARSLIRAARSARRAVL